MVAKAAWLTIEPRVCLSDFLASDEPKYASSAQSLMFEEGNPDDEEQGLRCSGDDSLEIE